MSVLVFMFYSDLSSLSGCTCVVTVQVSLVKYAGLWAAPKAVGMLPRLRLQEGCFNCLKSPGIPIRVTIWQTLLVSTSELYEALPALVRRHHDVECHVPWKSRLWRLVCWDWIARGYRTAHKHHYQFFSKQSQSLPTIRPTINRWTVHNRLVHT